MGLLQATLRPRLKNKALEKCPGLLDPSEDLCQLSFLPGIFPGFLTKGGVLPRTLLWEAVDVCCWEEKDSEVVEYSLKGCWGPTETIECTHQRAQGPYSEDSTRCLNYVNSQLGTGGREGAGVRCPWLTCQERAALGKRTWPAWIIQGFYQLASFLPVRFKEVRGRNGWNPCMEHMKDKSSFEFLNTVQSYPHVQKLCLTYDPIYSFHQAGLVTGCNVPCWVHLWWDCALTQPDCSQARLFAERLRTEAITGVST